MKRDFSSTKRMLVNHWFLLLLPWAISPVYGVFSFILAVSISMIFFSKPKNEKDIRDYLTDEELEVINNRIDVDDEKYVKMLAKYQSFTCPVKADKITTWVSSEVSNDAFICNYEINDERNRYGDIDMEVVKKRILRRIDPDNVERIVATGRNIIFRYKNCQTGTTDDVVLSNEELSNL